MAGWHYLFIPIRHCTLPHHPPRHCTHYLTSPSVTVHYLPISFRDCTLPPSHPDHCKLPPSHPSLYTTSKSPSVTVHYLHPIHHCTLPRNPLPSLHRSHAARMFAHTHADARKNTRANSSTHRRCSHNFTYTQYMYMQSPTPLPSLGSSSEREFAINAK